MVLRSKSAAAATTTKASPTKRKAALAAVDAPSETQADTTEAASKAERFTPAPILEIIRAHAPIVIDPCTTADNPTGAKFFYTIKEDGLKVAWAPKAPGLAYCNPPYTRGELARWVEKVIVESKRRADREIMMLTPGDLGTQWASMLHGAAQAIAHMHGRIAFIRPDGEYETGAKQSSAIWYFGERVQRFTRVFGPHANVGLLAAPPAF